MKNLLLIFLLAPLLSVAQVPHKPTTNAVAQVVTLVDTSIMPTNVRPIVEGWFTGSTGGVSTQEVDNIISSKGYTTTNDVLALVPALNVTTQYVENAISSRGYTTTNDVLALIPSGSITTQDVESAISSRGYTTTNDVLNLTAGLVSETSPPYTNLLAISTMALRVYETNGVWKTLLPGEALP